jgi:RNA polymerase sigma factor (sigma-70 family)
MSSPVSVFLGSQDPQRERLLAELVAAHGSMVFGVCRRILRRREDAEDACQAVFLVLARNRGALRDTTRLAAWLHRVATRCAWKLHRKVSARDRVEAPLELVEEPSVAPVSDEEWRTAVDSELDRLPSRYRLALVLCYLEGRSYMAAAAQLGLTHAGLKTRLERGRNLLRERLIRRGLTTASALSATNAFSAGLGPVAATGWKTPSVNAIALSRVVHFQLAVSAAATKLLPLAACLVITLTILTSPRISAESAPRSNLANSTSALGNPTSAAAINPESSPAALGTSATPADYPHVIAWKKGSEDFEYRCRIEITEILGTKPNFEIGNRYLVRGKYSLTGASRAKLAFYITASGLDGFSSGEEPGQSCTVARGEGEFTLSRYFECAGDPHISFYDEKGSNIGGVYFSDGTPPTPARRNLAGSNGRLLR